MSGYSREALSTRTAAAGADAMVHAAGISLLVDGSLSVISPANSTVASPEVLAPTQRITATAELSYAAWKFQPAVRWTALVDDSLGTHHQVLGGLAFHGYHDHLRIGAAYVLRVEDVSPVENDTVRLWAQFRILMRAIPGVPGLPEPTFRTGDDAWVSLDAVVSRVCKALGGDVSPLVCKAVIQVSRHAVRDLDCIDVGRLAADVSHMLRPERIVVTPPVVHAIILAYVAQVADMGVVQVSEW